MRRLGLLLIFTGMALFTVAAAIGRPDERTTIPARAETAPMPSEGDSADDPAIWIHPTDPALSVVIGTDKRGGIAVYDLSGAELQYVPAGRLNNVDLRYGFPYKGQPTTLVAATHRDKNRIYLYRFDAADRRLHWVGGRGLETAPEAYGMCMYHSPTTGDYYVFSNTESGHVQQFRLSQSGESVQGELVREWEMSSQPEGCVADDELGLFYIGEENLGIWQYAAEPDRSTEGTLIAHVQDDRELEPDLEGLAIYYSSAGEGYLLASSQGSSDFAVFERTGDHSYVGRFRIGASDGVDAVTVTDGIDVTNVALNAMFPEGLFVAQDNANTNPDENKNFKLVSWGDIARGLNLRLDTTYDPRQAALP